MTDRNKTRLEVAALAIIFGAGSGWAGFEWRLGSLEMTVARIDHRVTAMYCSTIPEPQKAACQ